MKTWLSMTTPRLGWLLLTGLLALLATEAFTRALMPQNRDTVLDILAPDTTVGYVYAAGAEARERGRDYDVAFEINSLGLRDREPADDDAFRVLLIGNSFCVSHGVELEGSLPRALERELQRVFDAAGAGRTVRVINAANAGYNAWNYWRSYERWAPVFEPDAVVVGWVPVREHVCDTEDVRFVVRDGLVLARYRDGETPRIPRRSPVTRVRKHLARNSDLYVLLRNFFYYNERVQKLTGGGGGRGDAGRLVDPYRADAPEGEEAGRGRAFDFAGRLREAAARDGVPVVLLSIPQKADVLDDAWRSVAARADAAGMTIDRSLPARMLAERCDELDLPLLDLAEALRPLGADGFFEHDNHWNGAGIAAAAVAAADLWFDVMPPPSAPSP